MMKKIALGLMLVALIVTADTMPAEANTPDKYAEFAKAQFNKSFTGRKFEPVISGNIKGMSDDSYPADVKAFFASFQFK